MRNEFVSRTVTLTPPSPIPYCHSPTPDSVWTLCIRTPGLCAESALHVHLSLRWHDSNPVVHNIFAIFNTLHVHVSKGSCYCRRHESPSIPPLNAISKNSSFWNLRVDRVNVLPEVTELTSVDRKGRVLPLPLVDGCDNVTVL